MKVECGLRLVSGDCEGLSHRWRHGTAQLSEDRIVFRRFIPPGIRIPLPYVAPVDLSVVAVERPAREVAAAEAWSVNPTANVLRVEFRSGVAEWAVLDRHLEQSLEALGRVDLR